MNQSSGAPRRPPKPKLPSRATVKDDARKKGSAGSKGRVTTASLAERLDRVVDAVETIEAALAPQSRSHEVTAEENALLNLVDAIVDRRTENVLLPLAQLATLLDRLLACDDIYDRKDLIQESNVQLAVVLESLGLERIAPARGDESDPWLHEEVDLVVDSDLDDGLIERVVRPGIRIRGGRTLLPALVAVSSRSEQTE